MTGAGGRNDGRVYTYDRTNARILAYDKRSGRLRRRSTGSPRAMAGRTCASMYVIAGVEEAPDTLVWLSADARQPGRARRPCRRATGPPRHRPARPRRARRPSASTQPASPAPPRRDPAPRRQPDPAHTGRHARRSSPRASIVFALQLGRMASRRRGRVARRVRDRVGRSCRPSSSRPSRPERLRLARDRARWSRASSCTASLLHIGGNMLYLWIFGNNIEDRFGRCGSSPSTWSAASSRG